MDGSVDLAVDFEVGDRWNRQRGWTGMDGTGAAELSGMKPARD